MAEKMLRQIICETIHPEYQQRIDGCYECGEAERIADSILSLLSQRIKAKALTDEEIDEQIVTGQEVDAYLKKVDDRLKKAVSEKELIATVAGIIRTRKAVKAQHQAVLGELE